MRANVISVQNNLNAHDLVGEVDLNASAAVLAARGDSISCTKTGTGTYVVRVSARDQGSPAVFEVLYRDATLQNGTPAGALGVKVTTVTVDTADATKNDILITLVTTATAGGTGAAADSTAAVTIPFWVKIRTRKVF